VLATRALAVPGGTDATVETISLPAGSAINTWPYTSATYAIDMTLSNSGVLLGQVITTPPTGAPTFTPGSVTRQVTAVSGGPVLWSDTNAGSDPIRLSGDDTLIAVSNVSSPGAPPATTIYQNGKFFSAAPGCRSWARIRSMIPAATASTR
jgi:hypothetical protein